MSHLGCHRSARTPACRVETLLDARSAQLAHLPPHRAAQVSRGVSTRHARVRALRRRSYLTLGSCNFHIASESPADLRTSESSLDAARRSACATPRPQSAPLPLSLRL